MGPTPTGEEVDDLMSVLRTAMLRTAPEEMQLAPAASEPSDVGAVLVTSAPQRVVSGTDAIVSSQPETPTTASSVVGAAISLGMFHSACLGQR